MWRAIITIALFTFKEAVRSRLFWLVLLLIAIGFALTGFVGSIAISENRAIQVGLLAAVMRVVVVFLVGVFVISSLAREMADKGMELLFSLPYDRAGYYVGKLGGFGAVAASSACVLGLPLLLYAPAPAVLTWVVSLMCELLLIIALSLFLVFTFSHVTTAVSALMGFYLLARSMDSLRLMAQGPLSDQASVADQYVALFLQGLAYLLPSLSSFTRAEWLIYPELGAGALGPVLAQTLLYATLISAAAMVDLYRKPL